MNYNKEELSRKFEKLLDEFDFRTVRKVMKLLDWNWAGDDDAPTIPAMEKVCYELLKEFLSYENSEFNPNRISTGGFELELYDNGEMDLRFILEEKTFYPSSDPEEEDYVA